MPSIAGLGGASLSRYQDCPRDVRQLGGHDGCGPVVVGSHAANDPEPFFCRVSDSLQGREGRICAVSHYNKLLVKATRFANLSPRIRPRFSINIFLTPFLEAGLQALTSARKSEARSIVFLVDSRKHYRRTRFGRLDVMLTATVCVPFACRISMFMAQHLQGRRRRRLL